MILALLATLAATQQLAALPTLEDDRLRACMNETRADPAQAVTTASQWLDGLEGASRSLPQQCLGFAYMSLLRWDAAEQAFTAARDARLADDRLARARLGAMAGNAALAGESNDDALALLETAQQDATAGGDMAMAGSLAADRARALVALGRTIEGAQALAQARQLSTQDATIWLLSATLARRMEDLVSAQGWIETAAALEPANPAIGLEAGVIAALAGSEEAARASWQSVIANAPSSAQAATARTYLSQFEEGEPTP